MFDRLSLRQKIGLYVSALLIGASSGALLWGFHSERQASQKQLEILASALADEIGYTFEVLVKQGATFPLQRVVEQTATIPEVKAIGVTDRDGEFLFHNSHDVIGTSLGHPLLGAVLESEQRQVEINSSEIFLIQPLRGERYVREHRSDVVGAVAIWMNSQPLRQRLQAKLWRLTVVTSSLVLLSLVGLLLLLDRTLLRPIRMLADATGRLAAGSSHEELAVESGDELGELARSFNSMARALEEREASLEMHRNNLEELVEERTAQLETRNRELQEVTYTVSHDLKSPLVTIRGFLGLLGNDLERGEIGQARRDLGRISAAATGMTELLGSLLEVFQAGNIGTRRQRVAMTEVAAKAMSALSGRIDTTGVVVEIAPDLPEVAGDPKQLTRVLQNLIDNAISFMGDQRHPRVEVGFRHQSATPHFFVRDNGVGIAPQHHETVFGLFKKLDRSSDGSGIGLAIVKRIIEAHDGRVWVESSGDGTGCSICFSLSEATGKVTPAAARQES